MIAIIYIGHIDRCPYLTNYTNTLQELNLDYDLIYWDRSGRRNKEFFANHIVLNLQSKEQQSPWKKIFDFLKFRKHVLNNLKEKKYEKIIVLTTMSGIMILPELIRKYKNNYIFDYRDASYENIGVFKRLTKTLIKNSYFTSISSKGFMKILPEDYEYVISHNIGINYVMSDQAKKITNKIIKVGYIGGLRDSKYMKRLIDLFSADNRFILEIHGGGENLDELLDYSNNMKNVTLTGQYNEKDKMKLLEKIDLICYNYESSFNHDVALANKYYDAIITKKPLIGNIETYSGILIEETQLGISLNFNDPEYLNKIYNFSRNFNETIFNENCESLIEEIDKEFQYNISLIKKFLKK